MILIIHGEDLITSRKTIVSLQEKLNQTGKIEYSIIEVTTGELKDSLYTSNLFEGAPFYILDISKAGRTNLDPYLEIIKGMPKETNLVILSNKALTKTNIFIKNAKELNAKIIENSVSEKSNIFKFVDAVFSGNRKLSYTEFRLLMLDSKEAFYIFSMLLYGLRNVTAAKFELASYAKQSPYVQQKSAGQAKAFTEKELKNLYTTFYTLDRDSKLGKVSTEVLIPLAIEKVLVYTDKTPVKKSDSV